MEGTLHPDEVEAVLHRHHVGRLACVVAGRAYVIPITYAYADGHVYGESLPGRKLDALRADPSVAFEVDEPWDEGLWRSVVAEGVFEELTDPAGRAAARTALRGAVPDAARAAGGGVPFRLRLTAKSGRVVRRSRPFAPVDGADRPLLGIDLRAGDERNYPHRPSG